MNFPLQYWQEGPKIYWMWHHLFHMHFLLSAEREDSEFTIGMLLLKSRGCMTFIEQGPWSCEACMALLFMTWASFMDMKSLNDGKQRGVQLCLAGSWFFPLYVCQHWPTVRLLWNYWDFTFSYHFFRAINISVWIDTE